MGERLPADALHIWLLGGFRIDAGGAGVPDRRWRLRKAKAVVKLLALAQGHRLAARGRFERACRLASAAAASREAIGEVPTPVRQAALDAWLPVARAALAARADAAWDEGRHERLSWAVAEAERLLADPLERDVRWPPSATRAEHRLTPG